MADRSRFGLETKTEDRVAAARVSSRRSNSHIRSLREAERRDPTSLPFARPPPLFVARPRLDATTRRRLDAVPRGAPWRARHPPNGADDAADAADDAGAAGLDPSARAPRARGGLPQGGGAAGRDAGPRRAGAARGGDRGRVPGEVGPGAPGRSGVREPVRPPPSRLVVRGCVRGYGRWASRSLSSPVGVGAMRGVGAMISQMRAPLVHASIALTPRAIASRAAAVMVVVVVDVYSPRSCLIIFFFSSFLR